jgi:signal transduction histidine kinase
LENLASAREVQLQLDRDALVSPTVVADRTRLAQILLNFGSNAIKYNRPKGEVRFEACELETGHVRISVRDNGLGIPADKQSKLFRAFERAGQETGPIEGTGVGLFITKRLAELMHGAVGFQSNVDEGSVFWIDLPSVTAAGGAHSG